MPGRLASSGDVGWSLRATGAAWATTAVAVLTAAPRPADPAPLLLAALGLAAAGGLLSGRLPARVRTGSLDRALLGSTAAAAVAALAVPQARPGLALCLLSVALLALAFLPGGQAWRPGGAAAGLAAGLVGWQLADGSRAVGWHLPFLLVVALSGAVVLRRLESLRRRARIAEAVAELGHRALTAEEPDALLREALRVAVDVFRADYAPPCAGSPTADSWWPRRSDRSRWRPGRCCRWPPTARTPCTWCAPDSRSSARTCGASGGSHRPSRCCSAAW